MTCFVESMRQDVFVNVVYRLDTPVRSRSIHSTREEGMVDSSRMRAITREPTVETAPKYMSCKIEISCRFNDSER